MQSNHVPTIRLNTDDNVVVAVRRIVAGQNISEGDIIVKNDIPAGHKVATQEILRGETIIKYGQTIGMASQNIATGEQVHTHNMQMLEYDREYHFGSRAQPTHFVNNKERLHFQGIVRSDGRVATRNYIGVVATSGCSASVTRFIAQAFTPEVLAAFPNVNGVVPIVHTSGCGIAEQGDSIALLQRTLAGWVNHPNFAGVVIVGHGCEINQIDSLMGQIQLRPTSDIPSMNIQDHGGTRSTIAIGIEAVKKMLPEANRVKRQPVPVSQLIIGLECGGSDALSGITANPALGVASDLLVSQGSTVIFSETPEIYGAEHLLVERGESKDIGRKLLARIRWWKDYARHHGITLDNNPSPGNKAGGITTILEKSLGAMAKSGSSNLIDVYQYAEPVLTKGLVFMDTPGYDLVSVTGMVAGGANLICFSTGRGSVFGSKPVPTIKLATNSDMYLAMEEDMDVNCGQIIDGEADVDAMGQTIFQKIIDSASGKKTKSERLGFGDSEFVPWQMGAII